MKFVFMFFMMFGLSGMAQADCSARSYVYDFQDRFSSEKDSFDWCFKRVGWWGLDTKDGWRGRYCRSDRYTDNGYDYWRGRFEHEFRDGFRGRDGNDIFGNIGRFYGERVFRGWGGNIAFRFDGRCGYSLQDELPESIE